MKKYNQESNVIRVEEVAAILNCSIQHAYKIMRQLNNELKQKGMIVVSGRVPRKYFNEKLYM